MSKLKQALSTNPTNSSNSRNSSNSSNYKEGLPREAFAILGQPDDPDTWKLPHHKLNKLKELNRLPVDWDRMPAAVAALSPGGYRGERVRASAEDIIKAARHLARHYEKAGKPVPDTLAALI
jgi:hypothetical protein